MVETLKIAITGANVLPTILFGLVLLYWLTMIVGLLDLDFLDFDLDADVDGADGIDANPDAGIFHSFLIFLNMDRIPFMIVVSLIVFAFWGQAMVINILPFENGGLVAALLFIPAFMVSTLFAKAVTHPLRPLFDKMRDDVDTGAETIGQECSLRADLWGDRLGQAEYESNGKHVVINVKALKGGQFRKGERVQIVAVQENGTVYLIDHINAGSK